MIYINITNFEKDHSMIETSCLKSVVIFFQTTIELPLSDFRMTICLFRDQILLLIDVEAHCCYKCEKKTVLYPKFLSL